MGMLACVGHSQRSSLSFEEAVGPSSWSWFPHSALVHTQLLNQILSRCSSTWCSQREKSLRWGHVTSAPIMKSGVMKYQSSDPFCYGCSWSTSESEINWNLVH